MSPDVAIALLSIAGVFQVAGTLTVAINYWHGAKVGRELLDAMTREEAHEREFGEATTTVALLFEQDPNLAPERVAAARVALDTLRRKLGGQLSARWYLTVGICAYVIGTCLDTAAGVGALTR